MKGKSSSKKPKPIDKDTIFVDVDLTEYSVWDEDYGALITLEGIEEFLKKILVFLDEGWKYEQMEVGKNYMSSSHFIVEMSQDPGPNLPKEWGTVL